MNKWDVYNLNHDSNVYYIMSISTELNSQKCYPSILYNWLILKIQKVYQLFWQGENHNVWGALIMYL